MENEKISMIQNNKKITTKQLILCGLFTALIAVGAFINIPIPVLPFTLQFLFTMMAGLLLGGEMGAYSVFILFYFSSSRRYFTLYIKCTSL